MTFGDYPIWPQLPQSPCPNCGYCPHCGRSGYGTFPRPYWEGPIWTSNGSGTGDRPLTGPTYTCDSTLFNG